MGREGADGRVGGVGLTVGPNVPSKAQAGGSVSWFPPIHSSPQSLQGQQTTLRPLGQENHCLEQCLSSLCLTLKPFSSRMNTSTWVSHPARAASTSSHLSLLLPRLTQRGMARWSQLRPSADATYQLADGQQLSGDHTKVQSLLKDPSQSFNCEPL